MRTRILVAVLSVFVPATATAQTLRGRVVQGDSSTAASGVLVEISAEGAELVRRLTSASGVFSASVPAGRRVSVRALRIGHRPTVLSSFVMPRGDTIIRIVLMNDPVVLASLRVSAANRCGAPGTGSSDIAAVWEEARKALLSASLAADDGREAHVVSWDRHLDRDSIVVNQSHVHARTRQPRAARAIAPDSLERFGFLVPDGETLHVFGPDPDLLLSDPFLATHCFRLAERRGSGQTLIGLTFRPLKSSQRVDVTGTLWIDRATGRLTSLDFVYDGGPAEWSAATGGGTLNFSHAADGGWFVGHWELRVPLGPASESGGESMRQVIGGDVQAVVLANDTLYRGRTAQLTGRAVFADTTAAAGVRVFLRGTDISVRTDSSGSFVMRGLVPGRYVIGAASRDLDSLGLLQPIQRVHADSAATAAVTVVVPRVQQVVAELCGSRGRGENGLLRGSVRDADGAPVADRAVVIEWLEPRDADFRSARQSTITTDAAGTFRLCGAMRGWRYRATVRGRDGERASADTYMPSTSAFAVVTVRLAWREPR